MAGNDIGVTFIPSEQNQMAQGPRQGASEGDLSGSRSSDLGTAFKILSLRLPSVVSAAAPAPSALLKSPGASALPGAPPAASGGLAGLRPNAAVDPMSAVFAALLRALQSDSAAPVGGSAIPGMGEATRTAPKVTLASGGDATSGATAPGAMPAVSQTADVGSGAPPQQDYQSWAGSY